MPRKDQPNELILCGCGCGERRPKYDKRGRQRLYIKGHCKDGHFEKGHIPWCTEKYIVQPNTKMSETLAYILGVIKGDGYFTKAKGSWLVGLHVAEKSFAEKFQLCLRKLNFNPSKIRVSKQISKVNKKETVFYRVNAYSNKFHDFYKNLSCVKIFQLIKNNDELIYSFIRGFYESEGSARKRERHGVEITLSNTENDLIELIGRLLKRINITYSVTSREQNKNWKKSYHIRILGASDSKIKFMNKLNPIIKNLKGSEINA